MLRRGTYDRLAAQFVHRIIESEFDLLLVNGESCFVADSAFFDQMMSRMCWATSSIATKEEKDEIETKLSSLLMLYKTPKSNVIYINLFEMFSVF